MTLAPATRLGPYEILSPLGAGGMGEVYRARDTRLGREVAVKVLPPEFAADPERLKRFEREARATAALEHPNLLAIYDVGTREGTPYIVEQLLEGESLRSRLTTGDLPLREALGIAAQIARGLAAAHTRNVIHRDLKPENVFLTKEGTVKLLDFGLAKLVAPAVDTDAETLTSAPPSTTIAGHVLGTAAYMAPEQACGLPVDHRADIFAFGVILYELLSGQRPFRGRTHSEVIAAVLKDDPEPLPGPLPAGLDSLVFRCLEKRPENRSSSAHDLALALEALSTSSAPGRTSGSTANRRKRAAPSRRRAAIVAALLLAAAGAVLFLKPFGSKPVLARPIESLVVLPLKNYSGDASQDYFADAMTDALISNLAQVRALKVISRTSAMHYKDTKKATPDIGKELGVEGIIEGTVARSGSRVKVTAHLIDARQDRHLWTSDYDREMTDVLALQSEVVRAIVSEIRVQVTARERGRLAASRPVDPVVYDTTLKAMSLAERGIREQDFRRAIAMFQSALVKDPDYAPAWAGLGYATTSLLGFTANASPSEIASQATAAIEKALALDPGLAEAHFARATITYTDWDLAKAQTHYERALELRPGYGACHGDYAVFLMYLRDLEKTRIHMDRAMELDPFSPINSVLHVPYLYLSGHIEQAIEESRRQFQAEPDNWLLPELTGLFDLEIRKFDAAVRDFEACLKLLPERPWRVVSRLGLAYGRAGRRDEARKLLAELDEASTRGYVSPVLKSFVHAGLDQRDDVFKLLEEAFKARDAQIIYTTIFPYGMDNCVEDPRWPDLVARVRQAVRLPKGVDPWAKP